MHLRRFWLQNKNLKMWINHKQRKREWKHPITQRDPETKGITPERLKGWCLMLERMWENPHNNSGREGLQSGTLTTWIL